MIMKQMYKNKTESVKSILYIFYLYIFFSKTLNVLKLLTQLIGQKRRASGKLYTACSSFYFLVILGEMLYLL